MKLNTTISITQLEALLIGPLEQVVETVKMSNLSASGQRTSQEYHLTRDELRQVVLKVEKDLALAEGIVAHARTPEAEPSLNQPFEPYPFIVPIMGHFTDNDPSRRSAFASFLVNVVGSYVIHKFGNGEEVRT